MFYPHNIEQSVEESQARKILAMSIVGDHDVHLLGESSFLILKHIAEKGLPDCYDSMRSFFFDFYPDLPWNPIEFKQAVQYILAKPELVDIDAKIQKMFNVSVIADLTSALTDEE